MNPQLKPSEWVLAGSGAAMFLLTLPFMAWAENVGISSSGSAVDVSIWNGDFGFPLATFMPIFGLLIAIQVGLKLGNVQMPPQVIGFSWTQIHLVVSAYVVLIWIGFLIWDPFPDWGIAFWICFLGSAGMMTGSIMEMMDGKKAGGYPGGYPGQQPGYPPQQQPPYPGQQPPPPPGGPQPPPGPGQPPQQF